MKHFCLAKNTSSTSKIMEDAPSFKLISATRLSNIDVEGTPSSAGSVPLDNEEMFVFEEENTSNLDDSSDTETVNAIEKIMDQFDYPAEGMFIMLVEFTYQDTIFLSTFT